MPLPLTESLLPLSPNDILCICMLGFIWYGQCQNTGKGFRCCPSGGNVPSCSLILPNSGEDIWRTDNGHCSHIINAWKLQVYQSLSRWKPFSSLNLDQQSEVMHLKHCRNLFGLEGLTTGRVNSPPLALTIRRSNTYLHCFIRSSYSQWRETQTSRNGLIHPSISEMSCSLEDPVCFPWLLRDDQQLRQPAWIRNHLEMWHSMRVIFPSPDIQDPFKNLIMSVVAVTNTAFSYLCFPEAGFDFK